MEHEIYMTRCIHLAKIGAGTVSPNPMVGSVIVAQGRIIGEGYHQKAGEAHAEIRALNSVKKEDRPLLKEAVLYVNLEPCSHYGRTPPCSKRIVEEGIPEVVIGALDPNEMVSGGGAEMLRKAGVKVTVGILDEEARHLNKRFYTFHRQKRPWIILKWAESLDGFIAGKEGHTPISCELSNRLVHRWRMEEDAILVGRATAEIDDPKLNNRYYYGPSPLRILLDPRLKSSHKLKLLFDNDKTLIINLIKDDKEGNKHFVKARNEASFLDALIKYCTENEVLSILVEGGADTIQRCLAKGLFDEIRIVKSKNKVIGGGIRAPRLPEVPLKKMEDYHLGEDEIWIFER